MWDWEVIRVGRGRRRWVLAASIAMVEESGMIASVSLFLVGWLSLCVSTRPSVRLFVCDERWWASSRRSGRQVVCYDLLSY